MSCAAPADQPTFVFLTKGDPMTGPIYEYMAADHDRLDALLEASTAGGVVDLETFGKFRKGLLRHIGMEEKILFPAARDILGRRVEGHDRLRADHGHLAALLVSTPTLDTVAEIKGILEPHNAIEEGPDGVYAACERLIGDDAAAVLARLEAAHEPPVRPYYDRARPWRDE